MTVTFLKTP